MCAQRFLANCHGLSKEVCASTSQELLQLRKRWAAVQKCTEPAFLMAMGRLAERGVVMKTRARGQPATWCVSCSHVREQKQPRGGAVVPWNRNSDSFQSSEPTEESRAGTVSDSEAFEDSSNNSNNSNTNNSNSTGSPTDSGPTGSEAETEATHAGSGNKTAQFPPPKASSQTYSRRAYRRLHKRCKRMEKGSIIRLYTSNGGYSAGVWAAIHAIRDCGVGAAATARLLTFIIECLTGKPHCDEKGNVRQISRNTVRKADSFAGKLSAIRIQAAIERTNPTSIALTQDAGSGCRSSGGVKLSGVCMSAPHPDDPNCRPLHA